MLPTILIGFLMVPGLICCGIPLAISRYDPWRSNGFYFGDWVVLLGYIVMLWCVCDFIFRGKGTPAPWDPPKQLVVVGLYRYSRNPMYLGVFIALAGWTLKFCSPLLMAYSVCLATIVHLRVKWAEEPHLESKYGESYRKYRSKVPRWLI